MLYAHARMYTQTREPIEHCSRLWPLARHQVRETNHRPLEAAGGRTSRWLGALSSLHLHWDKTAPCTKAGYTVTARNHHERARSNHTASTTSFLSPSGARSDWMAKADHEQIRRYWLLIVFICLGVLFFWGVLAFPVGTGIIITRILETWRMAFFVLHTYT